MKHPLLLAAFLLLPCFAHAEPLSSATASSATGLADPAPALQIVEHAGDEVTVDLGRQHKVPQIITLLGAHDSVFATLTAQKKDCIDTCSADGGVEKSCHRVGIYKLARHIAGSPNFVLALPGQHMVKNSLEKIAFTPSPHGPKYITGSPRDAYVWKRDKENGKVTLMDPASGTSAFSPDITRDECSLSAYGDFYRMECSGVNLLYSNQRLVAYAFQDYSMGALDMLFRADINGIAYYIVQMSVKGSDGLYGMITRKGTGWKLYLTKPDYPTMC